MLINSRALLRYTSQIQHFKFASLLRIKLKIKSMARLISIVAIIGIAVVSVSIAEELYSDKYDDIDVKGILANDRLREEYYDCFMGNAPCTTADQKFYHDLAAEAIIQKCQKCTEKQKENLNIVTEWYTQNQPDKWDAFVKKSIEDMKKKNGGQ